jgi:hypothetical protein
MKTIVFKADAERIYFINYAKIGEFSASISDVIEAIECEKVTGESASEYGFSEDVISAMHKIDAESIIHTYNFGLEAGIYEIEGTYKEFEKKSRKSEPELVYEDEYRKSILFVGQDKNAIVFCAK